MIWRIPTKMLVAGLMIWSSAITFAQSAGKVLGKLGQTVESTAIRSKPSSKSRVYWNAKPYEYLIIKTSKYEGWLEVVMENMAKGYVRADVVARLPYDVTLDKAQKPTQDPAVSSDGVERGNLTSRAGIARYALNYIGTPYKWGGEDMRRGVDCSAFVKTLYGKIGVNLPRTAREQALVGQPITNKEDLQAGDRLYFWSKKYNRIGHTGIYMGNGYFIHSSVNHNGVQTDALTEKWQKILVAARR